MAPTARRIVDQVLGVKPGEKVLLVTDSDRPASITEALAHALSGAGGELAIMHMAPHQMGGIDPPPHVGAAMAASDIALFQTSFATIHTDTARRAIGSGTRFVDMWGWREDMMVAGGALANYDEVERVTKRLAEILDRARTGRFTTPDGCDMTFSLEGRNTFPLIGVARNSGDYAAFPDGEAAIAPVEGSSSGVMVNPFSIEQKDLGFVQEPIRLEIKDGKVASITGSPAADRFWRLLDENGDLAKNVAEFAVGTNPACRPRETMREAKKTWGTCHMAVGDSHSIGGDITAPLHIDMIFDNPTVWADDEVVVKDGKIVV
jgi:leucyl aminopeptidase (aminopeptidase T)